MLCGESIDMGWTYPQLVVVDVLAQQGLQNIAPALDAHSKYGRHSIAGTAQCINHGMEALIGHDIIASSTIRLTNRGLIFVLFVGPKISGNFRHSAAVIPAPSIRILHGCGRCFHVDGTRRICLMDAELAYYWIDLVTSGRSATSTSITT